MLLINNVKVPLELADYRKIISQQLNISKNKICFDLRIQRTQLNRYCKGDVQRLDVNLLCRICDYTNCRIQDVIEYIPRTEKVLEEDGEDTVH